MAETLGNWQAGTPFTPVFMAYLNEAYPYQDEHARFALLSEAFDRDNAQSVSVDLRDVAFMKLFCDSYCLHKIMPIELQRRRAADQSADPT
jgi:hypothetical protein